GAARRASARPEASSAASASVTTAWPPSTAGHLSGPAWWKWPTGWRSRPAGPSRTGSPRPDEGSLPMDEPKRAKTAPVGAVVIGAGPAGMAAAAELVRDGTSVTLVDGSSRFGGQYWRHGAAEDSPSAPAPHWHHGWSTYRELRDTLLRAEHAGRLKHLSSAHVWALDPAYPRGFHVQVAPTSEVSGRQELRTITAETVVLCPGAHDRQLP